MKEHMLEIKLILCGISLVMFSQIFSSDSLLPYAIGGFGTILSFIGLLSNNKVEK